MDGAVVAFQCPPHEVGKPSQGEELRHQPAVPTTRHLRKTPTQMHPHVQQHKAQPQQHEAVGRVARGRPAAHASSTPIAAFNPETAAVQLPHPLWRQVKLNQNEQQPTGPAFPPLPALGGHQHPAHRHFGREGLRAARVEGVAGAIATLPVTQRARPPVLPRIGQAMMAGCCRLVR